MSLPQKFAFVDIETTGATLTRDRIIEIGILRVENDKVVKTFNCLINPNQFLPPEITFLTGITSADLENAPTFRQVKDEVLEMLKDCVFVAHNVRFDYSFLKQELKRLNISFTSKQLCTVKLSRHFYPQYDHHNLDSIIIREKIRCKNRHRAFDDAEVMWKFFKKTQKRFSNEEFETALNKLFKKPSLPIKIPSYVLDTLPEGPGVYIFYGANQSVLYIGKSINLRDRVLSHFSSDHLSAKEMKIVQTIEDIKVFPTAGELGALLLESDLIKKMQPLYNRRLRYASRLTLVKKVETSDKYLQIILEDADEIKVEDLENIINVFKSKKLAKDFLIEVCKENELCERLLGVEKTNGACFGYRLGRCKGACLGKELPVKYNFRFINALSTHAIKNWPFKKPILIEEKNELEETREAFLVDKWCYLGSFKQKEDINLENLNEQVPYSKDLRFDLDIYKILNRFIKKPGQYKIKEVSFHAPLITSPKNSKSISVVD